MQRILILFAHPAFETSRVHRRLAAAVEGLPGTTFRDLYEAYPDFDVDVEREQALLVEHDLIVLQHPVFWYSVPPLLKQWFDLVLQHGWAYGSEGTALAGKRVLCALSTGGRKEAYRHGGHNRFTLRELLAPIEQTFVLCGMEYLPPFVVHGAHGMKAPEIERHARAYRKLLEALSAGRLDLAAARHLPQIEAPVDDLIRPAAGGDAEGSDR